MHERLEERGFEQALANATQMECVLGRKTNMLDGQWPPRLRGCVPPRFAGNRFLVGEV